MSRFPAFSHNNLNGKARSVVRNIKRSILFVAICSIPITAQARLTLSWKDNSTNESGFSIERSFDGSSFEEIGTTGSNSTAFADIDVTPGNLYYYRIRAFNSAGYSGYSNISSAFAPFGSSYGMSDVSSSVIIGSMNGCGTTIFDAATGAYHMSAAGLGFENGSDELRYNYTKVSGDFSIKVKLTNFAPDAAWARAGIMARKSIEGDSAHVSMTVNGTRQFEALYKPQDGGVLKSVKASNSGNVSYLHMRKLGKTYTLSSSTDGKTWSVVSTTSVDLGSSFLLGLTIGSEKDGRISSGTMEVIEQTNVAIMKSGSGGAFESIVEAPTSLTIGPMSKLGGYSFDLPAGKFRMSASGLGYETYNDALRYTYVHASGDFRLEARVSNFAPDGRLARTGIMIRKSLDQNARHASAVINGEGKFESLYRTANGAAVKSVIASATGSSGYVAVEKTGSAIRMLWSNDGMNWTLISSAKIDFGFDFLVGLAIGSETDGKLSSTDISVVGAVNIAFGTASQIDDSNLQPDIIGNMINGGEMTYDSLNGLYVMTASGLGYEAVNDELRYAYLQTSGDIRMVARIHAFEPDGTWARTGLMIRKSLAANAAHQSIVINGRGHFERLTRSVDGASVSTSEGQFTGTTGYLALERKGITVSVHHSKDGNAWTLLHSANIDLGSVYYIGLAIGSQTDGKISGTVAEIIDLQ